MIIIRLVIMWIQISLLQHLQTCNSFFWYAIMLQYSCFLVFSLFTGWHLAIILSCGSIQSIHSFYYGWFKINQTTNWFPVSAVRNSHTPTAAVLHIHLIRPIILVLCFCCCLYGPLIIWVIYCSESLCSRATWLSGVKKEVWFIIQSSAQSCAWGLDFYSTAYNETPVRLILQRLEVTSSLWWDPGIKCQWVFNLLDSTQRCCFIRSHVGVRSVMWFLVGRSCTGKTWLEVMLKLH